MPDEENCSNCFFYHEEAKACRRYPPIPLMLGAQQGLSGPKPLIVPFYPSTAPTDWCGEYQPKQNDGA